MANYVKTGKYFVAYKGNDLSLYDLDSRLKKKNGSSSDYTVKTYNNDRVLLSKIVNREYQNDRDPYDDRNGNCFVSGYVNEDLKRMIDSIGADITDSDRYHTVLSELYNDYGLDMFDMLARRNVHVCTVFYADGELVAGVTTPNSPLNHLYYGFTEENNELVYSNSEEYLKEVCNEVHELEENTYIKGGHKYRFDGTDLGTVTPEKGNTQLIKNNKQNAESLIGGLNQLLIQVTNEAVREKIEKNVDDYLNSDDPKKRILDYLVKELDTETQKQILSMIKNSIESNNLEEQIDNELSEKFEEKLNEYTSKINIPVVHIVKLKDTVLGQTQGGFYHEKFDEVLSDVQLNEPVMLIGPAGSGKNVLVKQVADALGLHMYYTNNASNEFKLTGFIDAGGNYRETEFYRAFKNGGLFNLDEIDASDPTALIVINSALANGYMAFPHETIDRHPDFRIVAAANTWGKGSDMQYVGRNALDGATLDRFDNVYLDYDRKLEQNLYPNDQVLKFMWSFRDAVDKAKIHHIVSTRGIGKVYRKEVNNFPVDQTLRTNVVRNLGQDDVNTIIGNMENINTSNKYYEGVKRLRLTK